jgi:hypothetical protein
MRVGALAMSKRVGPPIGRHLQAVRYGRSPWERSASAPRAVPRGSRPTARSSCSSSAATPPASSTSRAASGSTTRGPTGSASSRAAGESRSRARAAVRVPGPPGREEVEDGARRARPHRRDRAPRAADVVVIHPGFWLGADREQTIDDVVASLATLRRSSRARIAPSLRRRGDGARQRARLDRPRRRDRFPRSTGCGR